MLPPAPLQVNAQLESERQLSQRLRTEAQRTKAQLLEALSSRGGAPAPSGDGAWNGDEGEGDMASKLRFLESTVASLARQLEEANREANQHKAAFEKVGVCPVFSCVAEG